LIIQQNVRPRRGHLNYRKIVIGGPHTDNKVNLWAKRKGEEFVAHELMHLDVFDDAVAAPWKKSF
jgi:hypothetical protein